MKSASFASREHPPAQRRARLIDRHAQRSVFNQLEKLTSGSLEVVHGGSRASFGGSDSSDLRASIEILDPSFFGDLALGGSVGAAESYMAGNWQCDDLVSLVRILLRNRHVLESVEGGAALVSGALRIVGHLFNRNTRKGARKNIAAHYDLGNDFFGLWLDETMMYSSAVFERPDMTLNEAQLARLDLVCRKLDLQPEDHVVEVGSGWGGFALFAAEHYGCRVTTTTISQEQYALTQERVCHAGMSARITVLCKDFRDLNGSFDKFVSLEMIEAINAGLYKDYFKKCSALLKPDGLALIQAITMMDQRYARYMRSVDFIQRYIFPGSALPSSAVMTSTVARHTDLRLLDLQDIGFDYARTLRCWRRNFDEKRDEVRKLGYSGSFIRMWEYYLCYCEAAFLERAISDVHLLLAKPENRTVVR